MSSFIHPMESVQLTDELKFFFAPKTNVKKISA